MNLVYSPFLCLWTQTRDRFRVQKHVLHSMIVAIHCIEGSRSQLFDYKQESLSGLSIIGDQFVSIVSMYVLIDAWYRIPSREMSWSSVHHSSVNWYGAVTLLIVMVIEFSWNVWFNQNSYSYASSLAICLFSINLYAVRFCCFDSQRDGSYKAKQKISYRLRIYQDKIKWMRKIREHYVKMLKLLFRSSFT